MSNYFLIAPTGDAYENLARDEFLLDSLAPGDIALYLYVNHSAVIIGVNQNPYLECNFDRLDADGVQLVRRISGGGAVYHDEGNLNYSFLVSGDIYDERRQNGVVLRALKSFGIDAQLSGRNDISYNGLKFSGSAFCQRGNNRLHHGTLLISSELNALGRYLTPSKLKLEAKGIKSVRARVCNLSEISPEISVDGMKIALKEAFEQEYGPSQGYPFTEADLNRVEELRRQRSMDEWRINETPAFDARCEGRLSFGNAQLCLKIDRGVIVNCRLYTDSLDTGISGKVEAALTGAAFKKDAMKTALLAANCPGEVYELIEANLT